MKTDGISGRRFVCFLLMGLLLLAFAAFAVHAENQTPVRFGLTAVVVRENLRFLDNWAKYIGGKLGRPVEFVYRRSYREEMEMLDAGSIDFAWICGFPFIQKREPEFLELMAVPVYAGQPLYHSFIIVHKDSPYQTIEDLKGKVFAFSDPESNSGFLYPQHLFLERGINHKTFFRQTFFTFNHAETVEAVAEQVADGGAVDSYIWEYINLTNPGIAGQTRVIQKSPPFGFPPLVARLGVDRQMAKRMKEIFLGMADDPEGREFLDGLKLDSFGDFSPSLFDSIKDMAAHNRKALPWLDAAGKAEPARP